MTNDIEDKFIEIYETAKALVEMNHEVVIFDHQLGEVCRFCDGRVIDSVVVGKTIEGYSITQSVIEHKSDCLWDKLKKLVEEVNDNGEQEQEDQIQDRE